MRIIPHVDRVNGVRVMRLHNACVAWPNEGEAHSPKQKRATIVRTSLLRGDDKDPSFATEYHCSTHFPPTQPTSRPQDSPVKRSCPVRTVWPPNAVMRDQTKALTRVACPTVPCNGLPGGPALCTPTLQ